MLRLALLISGILSFWYFLQPETFSGLKKSSENVLGITTLNQTVNIETVKTALLIYCINKQYLPRRLNDLYKEELSSDKYFDLDKNFYYKPLDNCEFELKVRE